MPFTQKIIDLCPSDVFYNDLDKQAMRLCLNTQQNVRRYKGHPCVPEDTRMTVQEHVYDLVQMFMNLAQTKAVLEEENKDSVAYHFVIETIRVLLRHDMGESLFEPQTYLQKIDPNLPKIASDSFESGVTGYMYHLAQHAVITNSQNEFLNGISALQESYADFDKTASGKSGEDYAAYLYANFDHALSALHEMDEELPSISDIDAALIERNDTQHMHDYSLIENPTIQVNSPTGLFAKILDTGHLEDIHYEVEKMLDPTLLYTNLSYQRNSYVITMCLRAEKFIPAFIRLVEQSEDLNPFIAAAYRLAYTRVASGAMVLRPYVALENNIISNEPLLTQSAEEHTAFNKKISEEIAIRRQTIHALDDDSLMTNQEMAAKALCYRHLCIPLQKSMIFDYQADNKELRDLFNKIHADILNDNNLQDKIKRVNDICDNHLSFYHWQ